MLLCSVFVTNSMNFINFDWNRPTTAATAAIPAPSPKHPAFIIGYCRFGAAWQRPSGRASGSRRILSPYCSWKELAVLTIFACQVDHMPDFGTWHFTTGRAMVCFWSVWTESMKGDQAFKETFAFWQKWGIFLPIIFLQGDVHEPGFAQWTYGIESVFFFCGAYLVRSTHITFWFCFFLKLWNRYWQSPSVTCSQAFRQFYILDGEDVCMPQDQTSR